MPAAIITGSSGLVGAQAARTFHELGLDVVGIDNDYRSHFFGRSASTLPQRILLEQTLPRYSHLFEDIRDAGAIQKLFSRYASDIAVVIHAAAQPSHDWASRDPFTDFSVNAQGTLNVLEMTRRFAPDATFIHCSTNKVYGDTPNRLPLVEEESRWRVSEEHPYSKHGIDTSMSIDNCLHSLFGASKVAADVLVQEYGRYFGLKTTSFRFGCLTGPDHAAAELHGFLAYLVRSVVYQRPYTVFGHKGKQVRDNLHARDVALAFVEVFRAPRAGAVYNLGGGITSNCSVIEALEETQRVSERVTTVTIVDECRLGDHVWWISDNRPFCRDYPNWRVRVGIGECISEIVERTRERSTTILLDDRAKPTLLRE